MTTESPDIFISHNSRDKQLIEPIVERLEADYQIRSWLDTWDLHPAEDWEPEIQRALRECTSSAIVLGANGWGPYHLKEARLALERRRSNPGDWLDTHRWRLSPDGRVILTVDNHQQLRLWEATTGEPVSEDIWNDGAVVSAEFSPGGELVTSVTENGSVRSFLAGPPKN